MKRTMPPNRAALLGIALAMTGGAALIIVVSFSSDSFFISSGVGLLISCGCLMVGALLGFLFGIPKSQQSSNEQEGVGLQNSTSNQSQGRTAVAYGANTNLEEISDWLTKILVGVGLTQLEELPTKLQSMATYLAPAFSSHYPEAMAISIVLHFSICGFLFGFLWTRLFLGEALREADVAALGEKLGEIKQQMSTDAEALSLTQRQLNQPTSETEISISDLKNSIGTASHSAKATIFYQAWEVRSRSWKTEKQKMERTIPIFRALAASDERNQYHSNHAQLGYALKDKLLPDWEKAEAELSKAIEIRGSWKKRGLLFYEFNRAVCCIKIQEALVDNDPEFARLNDRIKSDLIAVVSHDKLRKMIEAEGDNSVIIRDWLARQNLSTDALRKK